VVGCRPYAPAAFTLQEILLVLIYVRGWVKLIFLSEWRKFPSATFRAGKKKSWWQLASRYCSNCLGPLYSSQLVSFLVGLRTYQHSGTNLLYPVFCYLLGNSVAFWHGIIPRFKSGCVIAHFKFHIYIYVLSGAVILEMVTAHGNILQTQLVRLYSETATSRNLVTRKVYNPADRSALDNTRCYTSENELIFPH